ncbi:hypothetical protein Sfulv_02160 [Streptomyces fulvorobeus]|uniref:Uncharacterized protein n=1 Tax=Streptomyces fulvorobeus TaxID=284028 RepID=A0A7J0BYT3_9ACTN|nr:hypothetical protein Sfulv_02160 [Streptomyces fulvorobeus]
MNVIAAEFPRTAESTLFRRKGCGEGAGRSRDPNVTLATESEKGGLRERATARVRVMRNL